MIKTIVIGAGGLAAIGVLAYTTRKWWMPLILNPQTNETETSKKLYPQIEKEIIERLSYEHIIKRVENAILNGEAKGKNTGKATMMVMPNKIAKEYYDLTISQGNPFFIEEEMTDEEKDKMVVVLITNSDNKSEIMWGRVFIPNVLTDDFHDFIPSDKLYMKSITWNTDDVKIETIQKEEMKTDTSDSPVVPSELMRVGFSHVGNGFDVIKILKLACKSEVWFVKEEFTVAGALTDYVTDTMEENSEYEPNGVFISPIDPFLQYVEQQEQQGNKVGIDDLREIEHRMKEASNNREVIICCKVKDKNDREHIANPRLVKADGGFEAQIQDAFKQGKAYVKPINIS